MIDTRTGLLVGDTTTDELIAYLEMHKEAHGNTAVRFSMEGDESVEVQFDHFANCMTIDISERDDDED